jgi:uncharacterized cupin superfamily protein
MPNLYGRSFEERDAPEGFRSLRAWLGRDAGAQALGLSLWEVPPGEAAYPYHYHLGDEELLIVLEGDGRLRTPDGWRRLVPGEVLSFLPGEAGAHQLVADGKEPLRFLAFSTSGRPDIGVYPDSGKLIAAERRPGGVRELFRREDAVDYWDGEEPPASGSSAQ